jgi:hypothetical protein
VFCAKVSSKPNSKQIKAAQKTFVQKVALKMLMKLTPAHVRAARKYFVEIDPKLTFSKIFYFKSCSVLRNGFSPKHCQHSIPSHLLVLKTLLF